MSGHRWRLLGIGAGLVLTALITTSCGSSNDGQVGIAVTPTSTIAPSTTSAPQTEAPVEEQNATSTPPEESMETSTEGDPAESNSPIDAERLAELTLEVEALLESSANAFPNSPGQVLTILSPRHGIDLTRSVGDVSASDTFRIASNTKTFMAVAIFRLVEDGAIDLNQTLDELELPAEIIELLVAGGYAVDDITVEHLLTHSAGLADHSELNEFIGPLLSDPDFAWTPASQIAVATENADPLFQPGTDTAYSDTGYVVLGQVIEAVTGQTLPSAVRELVDYPAIGLQSTWWDVTEEPPPTAGPEATQFVTTIEHSSFHPTFDLFGGGGLVADMHDLATFYGALGRGEVFANPAMWGDMTTLASPGDPRTLGGLFVTDALAPFECYFHSGYWGTRGYVCPAEDLAIAWTWAQAVEDESWDGDGFRAALAELLVEAIR